MSDRSTRIADIVLEQFRRLPRKAKPLSLPQGRREWTVLCGLVASLDSQAGSDDLHCLSIGTGMQCLPHSKLPLAQGSCLHDWHAEVIAMRAFNLFLLDECTKLLDDQAYKSSLLRNRTAEEQSEDAQQPFAIKDDVRLHMFCSEAPCGDASMEITMDDQTEATPWDLPSDPASTTLLDGRAYFSQLGVVRRKPSRADAPATLSKSCSDKLAARQCTSLLSAAVSMVIHPSNAYLDELIIPRSRFSQQAVDRAFGTKGRMAALKSADKQWTGGYRFAPFMVSTTSREFEYCRVISKDGPKCPTSNAAAVWTSARQEVLIGGSKQGHKQFSIRGTSLLSRLAMWRAAFAVASLAGVPRLSSALRLSQTYSQLKSNTLLQSRREVKDSMMNTALAGWTPNRGDDDFSAG